MSIHPGPGRPRGPKRLTEVIDHRDDGTPITVGERIIEWIRAGHPVETACLRAVIGTGTYYRWMSEAARITELVTIRPDRRLTRADQELLNWSRAVEAARAEAEARLWDTVHTLAAGGVKHTRRKHRRDSQGNVSEEIVVEETLPSLNAATWALENQYGRARTIEVRVAQANGALTDDERGHELAMALREYIAERRALGDAPDAPRAIPACLVAEHAPNGSGDAL